MSRVEHCHSNQSHGHCGGDEGRPEAVRYEGERYNLDSERGRDRFEDAIESCGVDYNRATNVVEVGGERYDLDTEEGRRAFGADARDGELDGRSRRSHGDANRVGYEGERYNLDSERGRDRFEDAVERDGANYNRATNVVRVNGERYDLDSEDGRRAFQADARDGKLDGRARRSDDDSNRVRYEGRGYDLNSERGRDRFEEAVEGQGGVRYNRATNVVSVNGERYDLDTERGQRAFRADWRDGELDGR